MDNTILFMVYLAPAIAMVIIVIYAVAVGGLSMAEFERIRQQYPRVFKTGQFSESKGKIGQSKIGSWVEVWTNIAVGLVVSFILTHIIFNVTIWQNIWITALFTVASVARSYIIRRVFNRITVRAKS